MSMTRFLEALALPGENRHGPVKVRRSRARKNPPFIGPMVAFHHPRHKRGTASVYTHFILVQPGQKFSQGQRLPINPEPAK